MTRRTKSVIAFFTLFFMACVCCGGIVLLSSWFLGRSLVTEPAQLQTLGASVVTYTLPAGYTEVAGMRLFGTEMVAIAPTDLTESDEMMIMLMRVPDTADFDQTLLQKQLELALQQQFSVRKLNLSFDRIETRTIQDREVTLTFRTGTNAEGAPYRQMSGLIPLSDRNVFILAQGAADYWNQDALDALLQSMR